jgi:hypothetical protein
MRAMHGERRVSARLGGADEESGFFSILLDRLRQDDHPGARILSGF